MIVGWVSQPNLLALSNTSRTCRRYIKISELYWHLEESY
ncbi:hypothetical protein H6F74_21740 [Trichocoleus sp. FACHB-90]|nr:hypothetical protein [Trichocoleus sp. FACHB-90]